MTAQSKTHCYYAQNYFKFFSMPETFAIDDAVLTSEYLRQQKYLHQDSLGEGDFEVLSYINNAYNVLMDPIKRAEYILALNNINLEKISCSYANDMLLIHENYELITDIPEKIGFKQKIESLLLKNIQNLETIDIFSDNFKNILLFVQFIQTFLQKVKDDVGSRH